MSQKYLSRRLDKIEERLYIVETTINQRILALHAQIESLSERDRFSQAVEFITLLITAFKLILLGSAVMIPWNAIRDFWVKTSMFGFIVKSSKRYKKTFEKTKSKKEKEEEKQVETLSNEESESLYEEEEEENEQDVNELEEKLLKERKEIND